METEQLMRELAEQAKQLLEKDGYLEMVAVITMKDGNPAFMPMCQFPAKELAYRALHNTMISMQPLRVLVISESWIKVAEEGDEPGMDLSTNPKSKEAIVITSWENIGHASQRKLLTIFFERTPKGITYKPGSFDEVTHTAFFPTDEEMGLRPFDTKKLN